MPRSFRGVHAIKFSATIAATLAGAAVVAAPAYAVEPTTPIEVYGNEQASTGLQSPVMADGRFYAIGNGSLVRYDWTDGKWDVVPSGRSDLREIATDGTNLVAVTTGDELLYRTGNAWQLAGASINGRSVGVASGQGFVALTGVPVTHPYVSTDGGKTYGEATGITDKAPSGSTTLQNVAPDYGCGIQWVYVPVNNSGNAWAVVFSQGFTYSFQHNLSASTKENHDFNVANLGNEAWVLAKNGDFARYYINGCNAGYWNVEKANNQFLIAVPGLGGVYEISDDNLHQRIGRDRTDALAKFPAPTGMVDYGSVMLVTSGTGRSWFVVGDTFEPEIPGWLPIPGDDQPPLIPPPDVPAVIDEGGSVIMPDLGVTPKNEDGQPVMAGASPWKPNATGWCEWRGNKVACVSGMDPLPEATGLYTLKANLSGTSVSRKGACRWTTTKPQCRVWLTESGKWRLTWSGENAGKVVSGARTVVVK